MSAISIKKSNVLIIPAIKIDLIKYDKGSMLRTGFLPGIFTEVIKIAFLKISKYYYSIIF